MNLNETMINMVSIGTNAATYKKGNIGPQGDPPDGALQDADGFFLVDKDGFYLTCD